MSVATFTTEQSATEDGASITGILTATDLDASDTLSFAADGTPPGGLSIDASGNWSFDPSVAGYQSLDAGETQIITVNYQVTDVAGGTDTESFAITVTDVNDAATNTGTTTGTVTEAASGNPGTPTTGANLNSTDPDAGESDLWTIVNPGSTTNGFGSFTVNGAGNWLYTLDNNNATVQALNAGQSQTDSFSVTTIDGTSQTITVTIQGATDIPILTGTTVADTLNVSTATSGYQIDGLDGNDSIIGSNFDDIITGGTGADTMTGTAGTDTFVFSTGDGGGFRTSVTTTGSGPTLTVNVVSFDGPIDIITGFGAEDRLDVTTPNTLNPIVKPQDNPGNNAWLRGTWSSANNTFTYSTTGPDSLVLYNPPNSNFSQSGTGNNINNYLVLLGFTNLQASNFI